MENEEVYDNELPLCPKTLFYPSAWIGKLFLHLSSQNKTDPLDLIF